MSSDVAADPRSITPGSYSVSFGATAARNAAAVGANLAIASQTGVDNGTIADGSYHPFTGPLNKQDGSVWLAEGATPTDEELKGMNFYVEGIEGEIPS